MQLRACVIETSRSWLVVNNLMTFAAIDGICTPSTLCIQLSGPESWPGFSPPSLPARSRTVWLASKACKSSMTRSAPINWICPILFTNTIEKWVSGRGFCCDRRGRGRNLYDQDWLEPCTINSTSGDVASWFEKSVSKFFWRQDDFNFEKMKENLKQ